MLHHDCRPAHTRNMKDYGNSKAQALGRFDIDHSTPQHTKLVAYLRQWGDFYEF